MMTITSSLLALLFAGSVSAAPTMTALLPPKTGDGAAGDFFGVQAYVDRDWLMVGSYGDVLNSTEVFTGVQSGTVKVYSLSSGSPEPTQILQPPNPTESTLFGDEIVRSNGWLAISAPRFTSAAGLEAGAVFLFKLVGNDWQYHQVLLPSGTGGVFGRFGEGLYASATQLWVGAPARGPGGEVTVYGLSNSGASFQTLVSAPGAARQFGQALVGLPGGPVAVGAAGSNSVYLLDRTAPQALAQRLDGPSSFGAQLTSTADTLIVAAPDDGAGSVHRWLRRNGQWQPQPVLRPQAGQQGDQFGGSLALLGNQLYIGAPGTDRGSEFDVGSVYRAVVEGGPSSLATRTMPADLPLSTLFGSVVVCSVELNLAWVGAPLGETGNQRSGIMLSYPLNELGDANALAQGRLDRGSGAQLFRYGQTVAIDGDFAMVGAFLADTADGSDAGSVYVYRRVAGQWQQETQLRPSDATVDQRFGSSVDLSGDVAVVGAYWTVIDDHAEQGAAYIFRRVRGVWQQEARLIARDGRERDLFGATVAIDGDSVAVAAPGADVGFVDSGAVYTFNRTALGWEMSNPRLTPPNPTPSTVFGQSMSMSGANLVVGAPGLDVGQFQDVGALYSYRQVNGAWVAREVLSSPVLQDSALFGYGVAVSGSRVAAGAPGVDQGDLRFVGAAWVYEDCVRECGEPIALTQPGLEEGDQYGISVALNDRFAVVGVHGLDRGGAIDVGGAVVFDLDGQALLQQLDPPGNTPLGTFGRVVDIDAEQQLIVGSPTRAGENPAEGAVWIQTISGGLFGDGFE